MRFSSENPFVTSFTAIVTIAALSSAHPHGSHSVRSDSRSDKTMAQVDIFSPYLPITERRKVCLYKEITYDEGVTVVTDEPCLKCKCLRGSLVCYLRVCPILPDPPPAQCVLLLRKGACCSELICEDRGIHTNHISRAEIGAEEFPLNKTSYGDGCITNGTLYASGSAMWTDRPCEYCYCIAGKERCVRPRCLPSPDGCAPRRAPHSCCPVRYECIHEYPPSSTTTMSSTISHETKIKGCVVDGIIYPEGDKVTTLIKSRCDNCFCMRGLIRCVPLSCAPPLLGCTPIILPGECCASSYNCSKRIADLANGNELLTSSDSDYRNLDHDTIINERSFPDNTLLTPSQIAEILSSSDGRIIRKIENNSTKLADTKIKPTANITVSALTDITKNTTYSTTESTTTEFNEFSTQDIEFTTWTELTLTNDEIAFSSLPNAENKTKNSDIIVNATEQTDSKIDEENIALDKSKTFINDTVNCTTEISMLDLNATKNNLTVIKNDANESFSFNDTQERILSISGIENEYDSKTEESQIIIDSSKENSSFIETSTNININPKFPSTSLIIPKDNDIFMVNVSTYVRTNNSVVTLRPVAVIPPDIEALLNISLKKNHQKDDYYDYDYKSSLPPSLPNLEIIPFLAIDAVVKSDEIELEKTKEIDHYATAYPTLDEEKTYLGSFSTIPREKYNATAYPYITSDTYNPTTFPPYTEEKYFGSPTNYPQLHLNNFNRNQVIYKQHINDKFQATTYKTILNDKFPESRYGIDKFDATVYPSLTIEDSQTDNPTFAFNSHNLFSPPSETEGGFLPRDPPLLNSYFNMGYSGSKDIPNPVTDSSLMVTDQTKPNSDDCVSNGRQYKNGELITEANACVVCFCYYGDIHCQDPECPAIKPGCRRIIEKGKNSCCGIEICNEQKEITSPPTKLLEKDIVSQKPSEIVTISDRIDKVDPFKDVIRTEPAPDLESLIDDMLAYSTSSTTTKKSPSVKKSTINPITTTEQSSPVYRPTTPIYFNTSRSDEIKTVTEREFKPTEYFNNNKSTTEFIETTTVEDLTTDDEEESIFSFDNVLKILLGDTSETTTKRLVTTSTTKRPSTTTSRVANIGTRFPVTPVTTKSILTTAANFFKNTYKYSFSKPNRTASPISLAHKNFTKPPKYTTKQPSVYPTVRYTKPKYAYTTTTAPLVTQAFKKMPYPHFTPGTEPISKKPTTTQMDSSLPFGAGLLKLAGCNIYGRMYRVGRIISELSGPCLECMCTEVGVQCTPLTC
ncbi:uncharacterized protein LOC143908965 [Arctopsyche grandis]|uniref:uncharacterized protein LOC143908965 n=1 Tax=Arctopsyche grandis TaxID=121162 RepID=UPI00406D665F